MAKKINNVESAYLNIENFIFAKKYLFYQIPVLDLQVTQGCSKLVFFQSDTTTSKVIYGSHVDPNLLSVIISLTQISS